MENFNKGQSALEYLMTYGWALVVIVIAVAALVILINPQQLQGARCDAKIGPFSLGQETSVLTDRMVLVLTNTLGVELPTDFSDVEIFNNNGSTTLHGFDLTGSGCRDIEMAVNETKAFTCIFGSNLNAGSAYDLTVKLKYGTINLGNTVNRPTVSAKCTGTIPV